ncbi:MAG TPA: polysaccharide biosynthesis/export family protein [Longimicrobium sp.]|nr:polysaccharide biosynthesis/export family protein [Longimicrobium sp.]
MTHVRRLVAGAVRRAAPALLAAFVGAAVPLSAQSAAPAVLRPGDAVRIQVWRQEQLSGEFDIAADSTIAHPLYRDVKAAGVPLPEVEARVGQRLRQFEANPLFVVEPLLRVAVGGEVRNPNLYAVRPEVTVLQAVARAGGLSERGRLDRVHLVRDGVRQTLDLSSPGSGHSLLTVRSGDQIYVERRRDVLRENIAPVASVVGAIAALIRVLIQ